MSFNNMTTPIARKEHKCVHCFTPIIVGEKHHKYAGIWEGEFQDWRVHDDCYPALDKCQGDDGELCNHKHKRGQVCEVLADGRAAPSSAAPQAGRKDR